MGSTFQRRSLMRKVAYSVAALLLLTGTVIGRLAWLEPRARDLKIRETDIGHVELTGKTVQLLSTGLRGVVVCGLWYAANEEQKRKNWTELEMITDSLATLSPHFIRVWLFQSWNLTYNVSVISDQATDQYWYIARGVELLGRGERMNQFEPEIRFNMGYYYQDKFGNADKKREYRSLFDLSCIDPRERSNDTLRKPDGTVDLAAFAEFCKKHPQLVRRIRRIRARETPDEVVDFMEAARKIPSRFEMLSGSLTAQPPRLVPAEKRFPLLPPPQEVRPPDPSDPEGGLFDSYAAGRVWFDYAQEPLPPPVQRPIPMITDYDKTRYRLPRQMATIIFRGYPSRAWTYLATNLEQEGWFDQDGWTITERDGFPDLAGPNGQAFAVGTNHNWAGDAWRHAETGWRTHGINNGLYIDPIELARKEERIKPYTERFDQIDYNKDPAIEPMASDPPEVKEGYEEYKDLFWWRSNRQMTNFDHFYFESQVEADSLTVATRKGFFEAERYLKMGSNPRALEIYTHAPGIKELQSFKVPRTVEAWKSILLAHREYRRDSFIQQDSFKFQRGYLRLAFGDFGEPALVLQHYLAQGTAQPPMLVTASPVRMYGVRNLILLPVKGPLDVKDDQGQDLYTMQAVAQVLSAEGPPAGGAPPQLAPPGLPPPGAPPEQTPRR